jgi:hypothetical protein
LPLKDAINVVSKLTQAATYYDQTKLIDRLSLAVIGTEIFVEIEKQSGGRIIYLEGNQEAWLKLLGLQTTTAEAKEQKVEIWVQPEEWFADIRRGVTSRQNELCQKYPSLADKFLAIRKATMTTQQWLLPPAAAPRSSDTKPSRTPHGSAATTSPLPLESCS